MHRARPACGASPSQRFPVSLCSVASTTQGECVLTVNGGANPTYCALICDPATKGSCGKDSTCEAIQGVG